MIKQLLNEEIVKLKGIAILNILIEEIKQGKHPYYKYWYNIHKELNYYN